MQRQINALHPDNREPGWRKTLIECRDAVRLSAAEQLLQAGAVDAATVDGMRRELAQVGSDPNAVFFYAFVQARATVYCVAAAGAATGVPTRSRSPVSTVLRGSCQMRCHICASTASI
ncbi:methyltransferase [Xanthomonas bromi]|uniref:Methyltransferase n=1 Tax=Xanthomonas bromi TaxID=56449 RepID=A0A1C3NG87_9XANT|nr:methyltransferase [Xanthomonas bromi]